MPEQILLPISRLVAAPIRVTHELRRIEHENHALRVVQDVAIEIALAAIAALGFAPIRNILEDMDRSHFVFLGPVNARSGNKVCTIAGRVYEFFVDGFGTAAERAAPRLNGRIEKTQLADVFPY